MVSKFTKSPKGEELISKINEIIDNLGGEGSAPEWGNITGTLSNQTDLQTALNAKANSADLATVATSGSYNDLTDKPTIPSEVTESTVSGWGFTKNTGTVTSVNNITPVNGNVTLTMPDTSNLSYYGTCATGASTQAKVVVCPEFTELKTGVSIRVKFTNNQTYNGAPTLNINSTGAKSVKSVGTTDAVRHCWMAGEIVSFTYDGTNWLMEDAGIASAAYYGYTRLATSATSTSSAVALTPATINNLVQNMIEPYPVYSTSATYEVGDRVRYNYNAWECNTAITTAEAWNAEHWTALEPIQTQIDDKQDLISDLATIRNGASAGATALQPNDNITELTNNAGYITGITSSDVTTALGYTPQEQLVSGTNIKTINNNSILGSGNLGIDALPSQTGQSGKFLTTDGTDASWATVTIPTPTYDSVNERITW